MPFYLDWGGLGLHRVFLLYSWEVLEGGYRVLFWLDSRFVGYLAHFFWIFLGPRPDAPFAEEVV